jgi:hypothetical protein
LKMDNWFDITALINNLLLFHERKKCLKLKA